MGKKSDTITIRLTREQARELRSTIDGWLDAGTTSDGDRDEGIDGAEREALEATERQLRDQLYK